VIEIRHRATGAVLKTIESDSLSRADLSRADLSRADLSGADLSRADLSRAVLSHADLSRADLSDAVLSHADLSHADLSRADLSDAVLSRAVLSHAVLSGADLSRAVLSRADLSGADLRDADLRDAVLSDADLSGAKLPAFAHCPEEGAFVSWKMLLNDRIAKLEIPAEAKRTSSLVGRKCRAEFARVLAITSVDGSETFDAGASKHNGLAYLVGHVTHPDKYDDDPRVECTSGIHFFITKQEAIEYR
jgi:hypothetical protein